MVQKLETQFTSYLNPFIKEHVIYLSNYSSLVNFMREKKTLDVIEKPQ